MVYDCKQPSNAIALADAKSKQSAGVYMAWFGWQPPLFDTVCAHFTVQTSVFGFNTDIMLTHTGGGARPRKLSTKMSDALLNFMRTGNPNGSSLPVACLHQRQRRDMILDDTCVVKNDPD
jgi:para-nitrobenzyl esterase